MLDSAIESLTKAGEIDSSDATIRVALAEAQVAAGRLDDAANSYAQALAMVPDLKEAIDGLRAMNHGPAQYVLAQLAWTKGAKDEAAQLMEQAVQTSPEIPWLHVALGDFRDMVGDKTGAEAAYRDALALDPGNQEATAGLESLGK